MQQYIKYKSYIYIFKYLKIQVPSQKGKASYHSYGDQVIVIFQHSDLVTVTAQSMRI